MKNNIKLIISFFFLIFISSCYYDSQEEIYPLLNTAPCDTSNATYSVKVQSIISSNCMPCHNAATAQAGVVLDTYNDLKIYAQDGSLVMCINGTGGLTPMPYNQPKLNGCDIAIIEKWVNDQTPY